MSFSLIGRIAAPVLAVLVLTGAFYHGDRLSITFPDGWAITGPDKDGLVTVKESGTTANCNVQTSDVDGIAKMSLAEVNAEYGHVFTVNDWADFLGVKPTDLTLVSSEMQPFADAWFHLATFRIMADATTEATVRYGVYVLPGRATMAGCYARTPEFPKYSELFDRTIKSFRPW